MPWAQVISFGWTNFKHIGLVFSLGPMSRALMWTRPALSRSGLFSFLIDKTMAWEEHQTMWFGSKPQSFLWYFMTFPWLSLLWSHQCPNLLICQISECPQDLQKQLCQLILLNGFATCPDTPGGEKLCVAHLNRSWLKSPPSNIRADTDLDMDPATLAPGSLFMVKGWNRAVCCLGILYSAWTNDELYQAGLSCCLDFMLLPSCWIIVDWLESTAIVTQSMIPRGHARCHKAETGLNYDTNDSVCQETQFVWMVFNRPS